MVEFFQIFLELDLVLEGFLKVVLEELKEPVHFLHDVVVIDQGLDLSVSELHLVDFGFQGSEDTPDTFL